MGRDPCRFFGYATGGSDASTTPHRGNDVEASSRWYQRLMGCQSAHGGKEYERLVSKGVLILQLHRFEVEHHHGPIGNPADRPYGNGVLLWFEIECWLHDPDGYCVVIASPDGSAG